MQITLGFSSIIPALIFGDNPKNMGRSVYALGIHKKYGNKERP